jgi:hypothetical protein
MTSKPELMGSQTLGHAGRNAACRKFQQIGNDALVVVGFKPGSIALKCSRGVSRANALAAARGLPPILVFLVLVADWSDGTHAGKHND